MSVTTTLERLQKKARARAFLESSSKSGQALRHRLMLEEVRALLEYERSLEPHPLEESELPFDRLRLRLFPNYRLTREKAALLGTGLRREYMSVERATDAWDPAWTDIPFTPSATELAWAAAHPDQSTRGVASWNALRGCQRDLYHELTHIIFFRLARPRDKKKFTKEDAKHYYALSEVIARIRDMIHSEEVGPARDAMAYTGMLNFYYKHSKPFLRDTLSFETFSKLLCYGYLQRSGYKDSQLPKLYARSDVPLLDKEGRERLFRYSDRENVLWYAWHERKHGLSMRLPPPPAAGHGLPTLTFEVPSPVEMLTDQSALRALYNWHQNLYLA